ncbi:MAG: PH domain-containing protein [Myxococcota bacterium]
MKISTTFVSLVPVALVVIGITFPHASVGMLIGAIVLAPIFWWAMRQSPIAYDIGNRRLVVHGRLNGVHTFVLNGTVRYPAPPPRMRLFGSSGFFGHTGWFLDAEGTMVRAFVSRAEDLVVVGTDRGPVVVSPADPGAFAEAVRGGTVR